MSLYYLMAQLPALDGIGETTPLPITEERFFELCNRFLGKKTRGAVRSLTLTPPRQSEETGSPFIDAWNSGERALRLALAQARAAKMKKTFDVGVETFPVAAIQAARTATEMDDPLAAEKHLNRYRLEYLESLRPTDPFCEDAVLYYGLKLKLILRIRQFDASQGVDAYRNIYNSIMGGDSLEALQ